MALKVKAKEQLQNVGKYAGSFRYIRVTSSDRGR